VILVLQGDHAWIEDLVDHVWRSIAADR